MFLLIFEVLTMLILIYFLPPIYKHRYLLKSVEIRVIVTKFDVDYGFSLAVP